MSNEEERHFSHARKKSGERIFSPQETAMFRLKIKDLPGRMDDRTGNIDAPPWNYLPFGSVAC